MRRMKVEQFVPWKRRGRNRPSRKCKGSGGELVCDAIKQKGDKLWRSKMNIKGGN